MGSVSGNEAGGPGREDDQGGQSNGRGGGTHQGDRGAHRCTHGYRQHLEQRVKLAQQQHLESLDQLGRDYLETLDRDRQEREIQVGNQKRNTAAVLTSLERRFAQPRGGWGGF
ncbi:unnamed protein product [Discosporangium mesarthrocarpum]